MSTKGDIKAEVKPAAKREPLSLEDLLAKKKQLEEAEEKVFFVIVLFYKIKISFSRSF